MGPIGRAWYLASCTVLVTSLGGLAASSLVLQVTDTPLLTAVAAIPFIALVCGIHGVVLWATTRLLAPLGRLARRLIAAIGVVLTLWLLVEDSQLAADLANSQPSPELLANARPLLIAAYLWVAETAVAWLAVVAVARGVHGMLSRAIRPQS